jgi:hypothetical protein
MKKSTQSRKSEGIFIQAISDGLELSFNGRPFAVEEFPFTAV